MKREYYLCLDRNRKMPFTLPERWEVSHFVESEEGSPLPSVRQMTLEALLKPAGSPPLKNLASRAQRIAILVDDATRPTPVAEILHVLLPLLAEAGVANERITIVAALGTHVPMTKEDLETRLGRNVVAGVRIVQHNAWQEDLVPVNIPGGGVVKVNPEIAGADMKIGISSILPHPMAGYGGGPKIIMPGVCNFEYIRRHHMKHTIDPRARAGLTKGNPFHEACMRVARAVGLDFSINCVYNQHAQLAGIIGGSLETAFAEAVRLCFEKLGHTFEEKVDVTITSTYPHTHGVQFSKGLSAPDVITKDTGAVLAVVPLVTPLVAEFLNSFDLVKERSHGDPVAYVTGAMSKGMPFLPDKPLEFNMAMSCMLLRPNLRTILVSPTITGEQATTMGLDYAPSVEAGIALLEKVYPDARVAIFPAGGLVVPITAWDH